LVSHAYPGDKPDVTQFPAMVNELAARFNALTGDEASEGADRLTLVFDAGHNSADNYELFEDSPFQLVGSLPPSDHPDLLAVPKTRYRPVDRQRFPGLTAFETTKVVFGAERRIVVTHSDNLHDKQSRSFDQTLAKARRQLSSLAARLARGKTRKPRDKVEAEIATILKPRWLSRSSPPRWSARRPPICASPGGPHPPLAAPSKTSCSASASWSPTKTAPPEP